MSCSLLDKVIFSMSITTVTPVYWVLWGMLESVLRAEASEHDIISCLGG